jgi:hypothetical protein
MRMVTSSGTNRTAIHVALGEFPQLGLILQIVAEDIASRDLRQLRGLLQQLGLRAFSCAGHAQQNDERCVAQLMTVSLDSRVQ